MKTITKKKREEEGDEETTGGGVSVQTRLLAYTDEDTQNTDGLMMKLLNRTELYDGQT